LNRIDIYPNYSNYLFTQANPQATTAATAQAAAIPKNLPAKARHPAALHASAARATALKIPEITAIARAFPQAVSRSSMATADNARNPP
jgi:hypothetical protein